MSYKEIKLRARTPDATSTEIMYEIAAARADLIDLVRINIFYEEDAEGNTDFNRVYTSIIKLLKNMKQKGSIQFYATRDSFGRYTTEAVFLQNKYPELFSVEPKIDNGDFIYVKI